jgi:maltooligosyltrehalose trehalohydrolase
MCAADASSLSRLPSADPALEFGARPLGGGRCRFNAWAPDKSSLWVVLEGREREPVKMNARSNGFYTAEVEASVGTRYRFELPGGRRFPDPASRFQPSGVHGPSEIIDTGAFQWTDGGFRGCGFREMIIYELHIGTFTPEGTFAAAISRLEDLSELGITAVELMPIAQFPGDRNWGYDGVYPFAVQNSYGGPHELQRFVNAAHGLGISVILDVVYNHLGPEGNYFGNYGPFFTSRYTSPWGQAINFDGADSEPVRSFFIQNALYWLKEFHVDALRLDAVHAIFDFGAHHFLAELKESVVQLATMTHRAMYLIAESDLNNACLLYGHEQGGCSLDAQWSDDFHHALHALLTGETNGYYQDFGSMEDLAVSIREGWRYSGQYSRFRKRRHGNSPAGISPERFVVFAQNHDQVGNRALGERLASLVDFEQLKLAAGVILLSPLVPLVFMGEEYGERRPFQYFTSHGDAELVDAVRRGRREEFSAFGWNQELPDPQSESTFEQSKLDFESRNAEPHRTLRQFYQSLVALRKKFALGGLQAGVEWDEAAKLMTLHYEQPGIFVIFHFGPNAAPVPLPYANMPGKILLASTAREFASHPSNTFSTSIQNGEIKVGPHSVTVLASTADQNL